MSKSNRREEIFHLGANATRKAYQQGLEDFNDLIARLEEMKRFDFIEKYSFKDHLLWITTSRIITNEQWNLGLEEVNKLLDSLTPQKEKLTEKNIRNLEKDDCVLLENGIKSYFVRWSWLDGDYAVLLGLKKIHKNALIGATRISKHQVEASNE